MKILDSVLVVILLSVSFFGIDVWRVSSEGVLRVHMLDVGQGDAFLIEAPGGQQMLIDTGPPGHLLVPLQQVMALTDRYIDIVLFTHPDADHAGSLPELLENYEVGVVVTAPAQCQKELCNTINEKIDQYGAATHVVKEGSEISLGGGVTFDVLWPVVETSEADNDTSVVGVLSYGDTDMLFTGDAGEHVERYLVNHWGDLLDVDALKVGHHGSKTSTSREFLEVVSPEIALISAGFNNQYGHPSSEVLERLIEVTNEIFETIEWGTVTLVSDGLMWREE